MTDPTCEALAKELSEYTVCAAGRKTVQPEITDLNRDLMRQLSADIKAGDVVSFDKLELETLTLALDIAASSVPSAEGK